MRIRIVTDSSTNVPDEYLHRLRIVEIAAVVNFGDQTFLNKIEISTEEFYRRLASASRLPTTAQPSPRQFAEAYARLAGEGAEEVIAVTVSSRLSGTFNSAAVAAEHAPIKVHLWDSLSVSLGAGWQAIAAAEMAEAGLSSHAIFGRLAAIRARMETAITPATLRHLIAGGRAPKLQGSIGEMLDVKPILAIIDGRLEPVGRVRGRRQALQVMLDRVASAFDGRPTRVAVAHANVPDEAEEYARLARTRLCVAEMIVTDLGPVLATLAGPGLIAIGGYTVEERA